MKCHSDRHTSHREVGGTYRGDNGPANASTDDNKECVCPVAIRPVLEHRVCHGDGRQLQASDFPRDKYMKGRRCSSAETYSFCLIFIAAAREGITMQDKELGAEDDLDFFATSSLALSKPEFTTS